MRVPIIMGIPAKDLKPDGRQPKPDAAASAASLSAGVGAAGKPGASQPQATYQGRTYDEWFAEVRRERSPSELISGLEALVTLGAGKHDEDVAREILTIVTRVNVAASDGGSNGALLSATERHLNRLQPEAAVPVITEAVRSANPAIVWYVIQRLIPDLDKYKWNTIETKTTGPVSLALYRNPGFRAALLSTWPKVTPEMRPQFIIAASLFADGLPPEGELPEAGLLKWLADVAGGEDAETLLSSADSQKMYACRALAQIYPECPELPQWTLDGLLPFRQRKGSQWWQYTANGWTALKMIGQRADGQSGRLAQWITDTDESFDAVIEFGWIDRTETGQRDSHSLAAPRRLVMLEALRAISLPANLGDEARSELRKLRSVNPQFATEALDDARSVQRADEEFAREVEESVLDALIETRDGANSYRLTTIDSDIRGMSSLDGAKLVVAHCRCQKLIAELLGEAEPSPAPEKQPESSGTE